MKTALLMIVAIIAAAIVPAASAIHESPVPVNTPKNNSTVEYPIKSETDYQYRQDSSSISNTESKGKLTEEESAEARSKLSPESRETNANLFCGTVVSFLKMGLPVEDRHMEHCDTLIGEVNEDQGITQEDTEEADKEGEDEEE